MLPDGLHSRRIGSLGRQYRLCDIGVRMALFQHLNVVLFTVVHDGVASQLEEYARQLISSHGASLR